MRQPSYRRLSVLLAPVAVGAMLATAIHSSLASPIRAAGQLALKAGAAPQPGHRSSIHLPYFTFVRALRPGS